jgi:RNA polymerase sigma-70 factor, ECF subfamily
VRVHDGTPPGTVAAIPVEPVSPVTLPASVDDRLLAARAQAGDRKALDTLLRRHYDLVHAVCRRITGNDADAADAAQEALLRAVRGLATFDSRARFSTWIYRVAVNASLDEVRRRSRRPAVISSMAMSMEDLGVEATGGPALVADRVDIDAALRVVAPEFRAAVVLRDLCGLGYVELADVLGVPVGTAKSRVARGRAALARLLGDQGGDA